MCKIMQRHTVAFLIILCLFVTATSCTRRETPVLTGDRDGTIHLGCGSEPGSLDPHLVTGVPGARISAGLLEGLVSVDHRDLQLHPIPGAAASWDISEDMTVYTFHLRQNARWSNGDPLTAADFVYAFQRILSPELGSPYAYMLHGLKNAEPFNRGELKDFSQVGARAVDDLTLVLTLEAPVPYLLSLLYHHSWYPVHRPTIEAHGGMAKRDSRWTLPENYVGNGAFVIREWVQDKHIVLEKSPTYWDRDSVRLNRVVFHPIGDHTTEERAFQAGQLHVTETVPLDRIAYYREQHPELLQLEPYLGVYYYAFNTQRPPMDNLHVRRALVLAVDREKITQFVTKGGETPAGHFTPTDTAGYTSRARLDYDPEAARAELAEAGYPNGEGFPATSLLYNNSDAHARIAQVIQQMWKQTLGIHIELESMEWKVYLAETEKGNFQIARRGWIADYVDPNSFLDLWVTGGGNNRANWSNAEYDRLIREAARRPVPTERMECFQQAEAILLREAPVLPIYFYRSKSLVKPSVRGWHPTILDIHPLKALWLEPSGE